MQRSLSALLGRRSLAVGFCRCGQDSSNDTPLPFCNSPEGTTWACSCSLHPRKPKGECRAASQRSACVCWVSRTFRRGGSTARAWELEECEIEDEPSGSWFQRLERKTCHVAMPHSSPSQSAPNQDHQGRAYERRDCAIFVPRTRCYSRYQAIHRGSV